MHRMYRVNPQMSDGDELAGDADTSIRISTGVRDELRRYKAEDGLTYGEAIVRLLTDAEWFDGDNDGETSQ